MTRSMGRPRTEGNKDLPDGLHPPAGGVGSWRMAHPVTGRLKRLKGVKTKADAIEMYWAVKRHFQTKVEDRAAQFAGGPLTSDLIETYRTDELKDARTKSGALLDDNTRRTYDNYLENFHDADEFKVPLSLFGHPDEGPRQVRKYLAPWLKQPKTYNYRLSLLNRLFNHWIDKGLIVRNPCNELNHRTAIKRDVYMPDEDFLLITGKLATEYHEVYARACDWLYLMSGRPTNMLDVQESQIIDSPAEIHYYASKNDQPVIVDREPEIDSLIAWFRHYKKTQKNEKKKQTGIVSPHLIVHPLTAQRGLAGKPITTERLYRYFKQAMLGANIKTNYTLRDIRPKALTDEAVLAGKATNKGVHKTQQMREHYVRIKLPVRVQNNLRRLKQG